MFYFCNQLINFLFTEDPNIAGPSDLIMTRGNLDDGEEEEVDSDTDDIDHSGEKKSSQAVTTTAGGWSSIEVLLKVVFEEERPKCSICILSV